MHAGSCCLLPLSCQQAHLCCRRSRHPCSQARQPGARWDKCDDRGLGSGQLAAHGAGRDAADGARMGGCGGKAVRVGPPVGTATSRLLPGGARTEPGPPLTLPLLLLQLAEKVLPLATCQAAWGTAVDWNGDALADPLNFQTNSMMCAARELHSVDALVPGLPGQWLTLPWGWGWGWGWCDQQHVQGRRAPSPHPPPAPHAPPISCLQAPTIQTTSRGSALATREARCWCLAPARQPTRRSAS